MFQCNPTSTLNEMVLTSVQTAWDCFLYSHCLQWKVKHRFKILVLRLLDSKPNSDQMALFAIKFVHIGSQAKSVRLTSLDI